MPISIFARIIVASCTAGLLIGTGVAEASQCPTGGQEHSANIEVSAPAELACVVVEVVEDPCEGKVFINIENGCAEAVIVTAASNPCLDGPCVVEPGHSMFLSPARDAEGHVDLEIELATVEGDEPAVVSVSYDVIPPEPDGCQAAPSSAGGGWWVLAGLLWVATQRRRVTGRS